MTHFLSFLWWCADKSRTMSLEHTKWFYLGLQLGVKLHYNILVSGKLSLAEITRNTKILIDCSDLVQISMFILSKKEILPFFITAQGKEKIGQSLNFVTSVNLCS